MVPPVMTPAEAVALVNRIDTVGFGLGPANPDGFLSALGDRHDWENLVLGGALLLGYYTVLAQPGVHYRSGFFGPAERVLLSPRVTTSSSSRRASASSARSSPASPLGSWPSRPLRPTPRAT